MQASIESTGNLERRLSFSLPEERLQSHIVGRLGDDKPKKKKRR